MTTKQENCSPLCVIQSFKYGLSSFVPWEGGTNVTSRAWHISQSSTGEHTIAKYKSVQGQWLCKGGYSRGAERPQDGEPLGLPLWERPHSYCLIWHFPGLPWDIPCTKRAGRYFSEVARMKTNSPTFLSFIPSPPPTPTPALGYNFAVEKRNHFRCLTAQQVDYI
jgi:hypothetical protein